MKKIEEAYERYRVVLGKTLLVGLELLVAADIIRTVALDLTLINIALLGALVVVRTFLGWSIDRRDRGPLAVAKSEGIRIRYRRRGDEGRCHIMRDKQLREIRNPTERARIAMEDILARIFGESDGPGERAHEISVGPASRFMAIIFAIKDGRKDAREGREPISGHLFTDPEQPARSAAKRLEVGGQEFSSSRSSSMRSTSI